MTAEVWRVLLVEDDTALAGTTIKALERRRLGGDDRHVVVHHVEHFKDGLVELRAGAFDSVVLDIRDESRVDGMTIDETAIGDATGADIGLSLFREIRDQTFVPVVFYSAVAHLADSLVDVPFVQSVSKLEDNSVDLLRAALGSIFDSGLPNVHRRIVRRLDTVYRQFVQDFLRPNWTQFAPSDGIDEVEHLLVRRLARALGGAPSIVAGEANSDKVLPTRMFVMPPAEDVTTGDLVKSVGGNWFVVLTPACDFVQRGAKRRAEFVMMASCSPLTVQIEYELWVNAGRPEKFEKLDNLISNRRDRAQLDRYFYLPGAWRHPDLIVDLQRIVSRRSSEIESFERYATLDEPYAQNLTAQLNRFIGRVGTPDVDLRAVRDRLL